MQVRTAIAAVLLALLVCFLASHHALLGWMSAGTGVNCRCSTPAPSGLAEAPLSPPVYSRFRVN